LDGGGGSRVMTLNSGGLSVAQGAVNVENGPLNFGNRLGQHVKLYGNEYGLGIQNSTSILFPIGTTIASTSIGAYTLPPTGGAASLHLRSTPLLLSFWGV
jgi:hypothetical protein